MRVEIALVKSGCEVRLGPAEPRSGCPMELVDDLARFHLAARRLGWSVRLRSASRDLVELLVLVGLDEVLQVEGGHRTVTPGGPTGGTGT